jgi:hypothetical protein
MLLVEEEAVLPVEDSRPRAATNEIAERISRDGGDGESGKKPVDIEIAAGGEEPGRNQERVAG